MRRQSIQSLLALEKAADDAGDVCGFQRSGAGVEVWAVVHEDREKIGTRRDRAVLAARGFEPACGWRAGGIAEAPAWLKVEVEVGGAVASDAVISEFFGPEEGAENGLVLEAKTFEAALYIVEEGSFSRGIDLAVLPIGGVGKEAVVGGEDLVAEAPVA